MKILLLGGSGQLGTELQKRVALFGHEVVAPLWTEIDVGSVEQVRQAAACAPRAILNVAAYTAVDKAESEREACFHVNERGAQVTALVAREHGIRHLWVSTDYVFAGTLGRPLRETDQTSPLGVYGASKAAGERAISEVYPERSLIVRTSSLHGRQGENFVHTMLRLFATKTELKVVADQIMSPTWAGWLAEVLLSLLTTEETGIVHASGAGYCSWYEFAAAILAEAQGRYGIGKNLTLLQTTAAEFARPAPRPQFSAFDTSKLQSILGKPSIGWHAGLCRHLDEIKVVNGDGTLG